MRMRPGSRGSQALEHELSSCGTCPWLLRCVWGLPGPGVTPSSSALVCGFLTAEPPGKPIASFLALLVEAALPVVPPTPRSGERSPPLL